jgi:hypothetical protein
MNMDAEGFIQWALDDARTVEERFTLELLVEQGVHHWGRQRKIYRGFNWEERRERERQRSLNPAYQPQFSEIDVHRTAECLHLFKSWWLSRGLHERPIRDLKAIAFLTEMEDLKIGCEAADVSVFATLPKLRVLHFSSADCDDFSPLAGCRQLRELGLGLGRSGVRVGSHWPRVTGLEQLQQLETLSLTGNLLVFAPGVTWPNVRTATLHCDPLPARSVRELPQLPACEFLTLSGVERLDGIEHFPRLRNLALGTDTHSFEPLAVLKDLTAITCSGFAPLDVRPLTRLPKLQCLLFNANYKYSLTAPTPRDFSPLAEAPVLRELIVTGCPPVEQEVQTLQALLLPWDDELLAADPRPVPPLQLIIAPVSKSFHPHTEAQCEPDDHGRPDVALRKSQSVWLGRYLFKAVSQKIGCEDWGKATGDCLYRTFIIEIHAYAIVEKSREILEAVRAALARLKHDYAGTFWIRLESPVLTPSPAQVELEKKFQEERDRADWERQHQERQDLLERQHRLELKKQLGEKIKPEDFVVPPPTPLPPAPWERDEPEEEDDGMGSGDIAVKEKVDPPPSLLDNDHPLAYKYSLLATLTLGELWVMPQHRDIAVYLMGQPPDREIPDDAK